jgi:hypothetical protein
LKVLEDAVVVATTYPPSCGVDPPPAGAPAGSDRIIPSPTSEIRVCSWFFASSFGERSRKAKKKKPESGSACSTAVTDFIKPERRGGRQEDKPRPQNLLFKESSTRKPSCSSRRILLPLLGVDDAAVIDIKRNYVGFGHFVLFSVLHVEPYRIHF